MISPSDMVPGMKIYDPQRADKTLVVISNEQDKRPGQEEWHRVKFNAGRSWSYHPGGDYDEAAWTLIEEMIGDQDVIF